MSFVGSTIGNIRIDSLLGVGGMGEVYLGFDKRLERRVAVKTIRPEQRLSGRLKARFLREAQLLSKLGHPAICQVYDLIEAREADFLILEYVEGKTLSRLAAEGALGYEEKLLLAEKIAAALAVAHRERIVHRDLKADNIMVTPEGEVKVLDFGVARSLSEAAPRDEEEEEEVSSASWLDMPGETSLSQAESTVWLGQTARPARQAAPADLTWHGMVVGTVYAMSPEQASGARVTESSDLYSFGILLQELFTGQPVYEGTDVPGVMAQVVRAKTRPITGLDPDLTELIRDLESLEPHRRPSAEETARRLRWLIDKPQRLRHQRRRRIALTGAFALLLAVLAVVSVLAVAATRARREADRRRQQAEGLIGFMIGDLRPKLEAVGRVDVLDSVGDRALAYFDALPEGQLSDEELHQRVIAISQIGEVRRQQGDLTAAMAALRRAEALGRDLVARDPAQDDWQEALMDTRSWIGQVFLEQGRSSDALAAWRGTLAIARARLAAHPDSSRWLASVATAQHNVGTVLEAQGDLAGALSSYQESLTLKSMLAAARPDDPQLQAEHAATLGWVSNALERQGDLVGALEQRRRYVALEERLAAAAPNDSSRLQDLAVARGFLAGLLAALGDRETAGDLYRTGLAAIDELAARDSENAELQRWRGAFLSALAWLAVEEGNPGDALPQLRTARGLIERLVAQDATNTDWRIQLAVCRSRTAAALEGIAPYRARDEARAALALLTPLVREEPGDALRGHAAGAEVTLGRIEASLGNVRESREAWERALAVLGPRKSPPSDWKLLAPRTEALLALGRLDEARPAVERLQRMGYCGRTFLELVSREGSMTPSGSKE